MPKINSPKKDLQRSLNRLSLLTGKLVFCEKVPYLIWPQKVIRPRVLLNELKEKQTLSLAVLKSAVEMKKEPYLLTPHRLGAMQRDLRSLEKNQQASQQIKEAPRFFQKHGKITEEFMMIKQSEIQTISDAWKKKKEGAPLLKGPSWFQEVLSFIALLSDPENASNVAQLFQMSLHQGLQERRAARKRFSQFLEMLEQSETKQVESSEFDDSEYLLFLQQMVALTKQVALRPGRTRLKQLQKIVNQVLTWPDLEPDLKIDQGDRFQAITKETMDGEALVEKNWMEQIRILGELWIQSIPSSKTPQYQEQLAWVLAFYGLLLPGGFGSIHKKQVISRNDVTILFKNQEFIERNVKNGNVSIFQLIPLLQCKQGSWEKAQFLAWMEKGLDWKWIEQMIQYNQEKYIQQEFKNVEILQKYCEWVCTLIPYGKRLGLELELSPRLFAQFPQEKHFDSLVLVYFVTQGRKQSFGKNIDHHRKLLDVSLGLLQNAPEQARILWQQLTMIPQGMGKQKFPAFSSWLDDSLLLDEYLHLRALAGEPVEVSSSLLRDFLQLEKQTHELEYLQSLADLNAKQKKRLQKIQESVRNEEEQSTDWTKRRLQERIVELRSLAYQKQLDVLLQKLLKQLLGISVSRLTPSWMNVIQFYWVAEMNQEWLKKLLHVAIDFPSKNIRKELPKNQVWIEKARAHFNVDAWLSPKTRVVFVKNRRYFFSMEQDPIESLQMGVPFKTCLSIEFDEKTGEEGINAASTILNAMDANKQILYVRDEQGRIVARQLLAISSTWKLLTYQFYQSVQEDKELLRKEGFLFIQELATESKLSFASEGKPEEIHPGFWYDDGVVQIDSFFEDKTGKTVSAYCQSLGRSVPSVIPSRLVEEASGFWAKKESDFDSLLISLRTHRITLSTQVWAHTLIEKVGEQKAWELTSKHPALLPTLSSLTLQHSPAQCVRNLGIYQIWEDSHDILSKCLPSVEVAKSITYLLKTAQKQGRDTIDEDFIHGLWTYFPFHLQQASVAEFFMLCDQMDSANQWYFQKNKSCQDCWQTTAERLIDVGIRLFRKSAEVDIVLDCFKRKKSSKLSRLIALQIAAHYPLVDTVRPKDIASPFLMFEATVGSAVAFQAVKRQVSFDATLQETKEYMAAFLRQVPSFIKKYREEDKKVWPKPKESPFAALGTLLFEETPGGGLFWEDMLAPFCQIPQIWQNMATWYPELWMPDRFELYYHRRRFTPIKRFLLESKQQNSDPEPSLKIWTQLGAEETLVALAQKKNSPKQQKRLQQSIVLARFVKRQIVEEEYEKLFQDICDFLRCKNQKIALLELPQDFSFLFQEKDEVPIDVGFLRFIFQKLHAIYDQNDDFSIEELQASLLILAHAPLSTGECFEVAHHLLDHSKNAEQERVCLQKLLHEKMQGLQINASDRLLVRLWQDPEYHSFLKQQLAFSSFSSSLYEWFLQLLPTLQEENRFLEEWISSRFEKGHTYGYQWKTITNPHILCLLFRIALQKASPDVWLELYYEQNDFAAASLFLDELSLQKQNWDHLGEVRKKIEEEQYQDDKFLVYKKWLDEALTLDSSSLNLVKGNDL